MSATNFSTPSSGTGRPPVVRVDRAGRTHGTGASAVVALHDVTCEVEPGRVLAVTGPSGSGKSTLLHLMAGLEQPTSGAVTWPAIGDRSRLRPGPVAVVFQWPSLVPALDAAENVALPLLLAGHSPERAATDARAALDRLALGELSSRLPEELSGGQAQRVAVARALAGAPTLILADEPTGQLDHAAAEVVVDALLTAASDLGAALVVTTHDARVAARFPARWTMSDGALVGEVLTCSA